MKSKDAFLGESGLEKVSVIFVKDFTDLRGCGIWLAEGGFKKMDENNRSIPSGNCWHLFVVKDGVNFLSEFVSPLIELRILVFVGSKRV